MKSGMHIWLRNTLHLCLQFLHNMADSWMCGMGDEDAAELEPLSTQKASAKRSRPIGILKSAKNRLNLVKKPIDKLAKPIRKFANPIPNCSDIMVL